MYGRKGSTLSIFEVTSWESYHRGLHSHQKTHNIWILLLACYMDYEVHVHSNVMGDDSRSVLTWATQGCRQMSSILMRRAGSRCTMQRIRRFTSGDVAGLQ